MSHDLDSMRFRLDDQVYGRVRNRVWSRVHECVRERVYGSVGNRVGPPMWRVRECMFERVDERVERR